MQDVTMPEWLRKEQAEVAARIEKFAKIREERAEAKRQKDEADRKTKEAQEVEMELKRKKAWEEIDQEIAEDLRKGAEQDRKVADEASKATEETLDKKPGSEEKSEKPISTEKRS